MASQFDFLKDYSEFEKHYKHFIRAEEYLYDSPQDTCSQITVFLEDFAKQLSKDNHIQFGPVTAVSKVINELYSRNIIDCELQHHAFFVINSRNDSLHNDVDDANRAKECLKNGYSFCKKFIRKYLDPTITTGYYRVPTPVEIRNRKIENLGLTDVSAIANELHEKLKATEALCCSKDELAEKQRETNKQLIKEIEIKEKQLNDALTDAENASQKHQIILARKNNELKKKDSELSEKEAIISNQTKKINELDAIVASYQQKEDERKNKINTIVTTDSNYLNDLNPEQKHAVIETDGFIRVLAGPGTGKTKTLVRRFVHLVVSKHVHPSDILCLTFTNKVAQEMRTRIGKWLGVCDLSQVCTFHSLCHRIVLENASILNVRDDFIILDADDKTSIIEDLCEKMKIDTTNRYYSITRIKKAIESFKTGRNRRQYLDLMFGKSVNLLEQSIKSAQDPMDKLCYLFLLEQRTSSLLEFDDLIHATSYLFFTHPEIKDEWQTKIRYIMVDEYQDVNNYQANMCLCLAEKNKNLFVVGDPNQTIYSWRHADVRYIQQFSIDDSDKDIALIENYRSTPEILGTAQKLICQQANYSFRANKTSGEKPSFYKAQTRSDEAKWIVSKMESLAKQGVPKNEIAVLFRNSSSSQRIEMELLKRGFSYRVIGGNTFYNSKEIKVVLSYLQLIAYDNDFAFKKVIGKPSRGIGGKTISKLFDIKQQENLSFFESLKFALDNQSQEVFPNSNSIEKAKEFIKFVDSIRQKLPNSSLSQIVTDVIEESGYSDMLLDNNDDEGLRNLNELLSTIQSKESERAAEGRNEYSVDDYLKEIATYSSSDNIGNKDSFILSTIHGAKGLEYQYVILCGLEENTFPTPFKYPNGSITTEVEHLQEERRLCFVALTRATKSIFITYSESQNGNDPDDCLTPSRFIEEMKIL